MSSANPGLASVTRGRFDRGMRVFLLAISLLWSMTSLRAAEEWLPVAKGNSWIYRGPTKWTDGGKVRTKTLTWRMEITEVLHHGDHLTAAVLKGFPGDLAWYEPGNAPGDYLLVRVGAEKYHLLSGEESEKTRRQFASGRQPSLEGLKDGEALLIDGPLTEGKHYGDPEQLHRDMYCWVVGAPTPFAGKGIKRLPAADRQAYPVRLLTNPDGTRMEIVPGVGIVSYHYDHHGTVSETNLRLVEVHLAKP